LGLIERLKGHLDNLSSPRNPTRHISAHQRARDYLGRCLTLSGREYHLEDFETELGDSNVLGRNILVPATGSAQSKFLVVAHYDTVDHSPGADDNGSAVAVALELACQCSNVAFLFCDLEEQGLLGSRHFVSTRRWETLPALVLESVGYWCEEPGSQGAPDILPTAFPEQANWLASRESRGNFWAVLHLDSDAESARQLTRFLEADSVLLGVPGELLQTELGQQLRDFGRSDHLAFWEQGRPCLMLTDSANFRNPNYHQPSDTKDTLDYRQMARLCQNIASFLNSL
jgi:Peptidase family M28